MIRQLNAQFLTSGSSSTTSSSSSAHDVGLFRVLSVAASGLLDTAGNVGMLLQLLDPEGVSCGAWQAQSNGVGIGGNAGTLTMSTAEPQAGVLVDSALVATGQIPFDLYVPNGWSLSIIVTGFVLPVILRVMVDIEPQR